MIGQNTRQLPAPEINVNACQRIITDANYPIGVAMLVD